MSVQKVNHPVWHALVDTSILKTANTTTEWYDTNGWTDKKVVLAVTDAGTADNNVTMHCSPKGYYELNNKTCTTADYYSVDIVDAHAGEVMIKYDSDDVADLGKPIRSIRFFVENDEANTTSVVNLWLEGWS